MKKRQMRNGEITHLPFLCCGNKNQSFLSTPDEQLQFEVMDTKWYSIDITVQKG